MSLGYQVQENGLVSKKDIPAVAAELDVVKARYGRMTPKLVVQHAQKNPRSILCKYLDLDNVTESAMKWWLSQARDVIRSVWVYVVEEPKLPPTRRWVSVAEISENQRKLDYCYVHVEEALTDDRHREQLLNAALTEIAAWKAKYAVLVKWSKVIADISGGIDKTLKKHRRK